MAPLQTAMAPLGKTVDDPAYLQQELFIGERINDYEYYVVTIMVKFI